MSASLVGCPHCSQEIEIPAGHSESVVTCPTCSGQFEIDLPAAASFPQTPKLNTGVGKSPKIQLSGPSGPREPIKIPKRGLMSSMFSFEGRMRRTTYWLLSIFGPIIIFLFLGILGAALSIPLDPGYLTSDDTGPSDIIATIMVFAIMILWGWHGIAIQLQRWHDRGKSGWWMAINLIPIIGGIWSLIELGFLGPVPSDGSNNRYGLDPRRKTL